MTPERWQQVNNLLQETLDRLPAERAMFLVEVCVDDKTLRTEVESLISFHERAHEFLETPALEAAAELLTDDQDDSLAGQLIGSYKIERLIGSGGMGQVYLAEDTRLDRKVAIKFLPVELETDELARKRQIREAKAAARLEHPNICAIYEVADEASRSFIVMQYVEGETLASRIAHRSMGLRESLDVVLQIADALSLAHSHGIIHRDIKPQNIIITPRGQVKVLDFGLAKMIRNDRAGADAIARETPLSSPGMILGTVPYLSPEQAKGGPVDARSDLFSLGVVLYECIAGKSAFAGNTPMEVCAQVIHVDPPAPSTFNRSVPDALDRIALKALAKEAQSRYQSAADLISDLRPVFVALETEGEKKSEWIAPRFRPSSTRLLPALAGFARRPRVLSIVILIVSLIVSMAAVLSVKLWWRAAPNPPSSQASYWYQQGTAALRDGTYFKASKALERAIQADDTFALAHARLAEAWTELDYSDKANHEILRARSLVHDLSPLPPLDSLYLQAVTHVVLREFGPAIDSYQKIAERAPEAVRSHAYLDLGRTQEKNDQSDNALESYEQAAKLAPQDAAAFLRLGILYGYRQDTQRAKEEFQTAETLYRVLSNFEGVAEVFYQRGFLFKNLDMLPEARAQLEQVLKMTADTGNHYHQIRALQILSSVSAAEGNARQAEQQATQAIQLAQANGIENQATNGLIELGNSFLLRGEYDEAEKYYKQALEFAQRNNGRMNEAAALVQLGSLRSLQRNTEEALSYIEQALPFYQQGGYRKWLAQALTLLGRVQFDRGDDDAALKAFNEELQLGEQAGDQSQIALTHQEIGSVLAAQEQFPEALRHFDESYQIKKSLNAKVSLGYSLMYRAGALWQIGRYEEAKAALDEATSIAGREGLYKQLLADIRMIAGRIALSEFRFQESKMKSHQALELAGTRYKDTAVQARCTLGLVENRSGASRLGTRWCEEAVEVATTTGDPRLLSGALLASAEARLENGEWQRALEAALQARDSFSHFGQQDSEWRAWLIAAQAKQHLSDVAAAREYAKNAEIQLSTLEQKWGSEAYNGYLARPDVQFFRKQLGQVLNP